MPPFYSRRRLWLTFARSLALLIRLHETHDALAWLSMFLEEFGD
jgi:hypothetical protein